MRERKSHHIVRPLLAQKHVQVSLISPTAAWERARATAGSRSGGGLGGRAAEHVSGHQSARMIGRAVVKCIDAVGRTCGGALRARSPLRCVC